MSRHIRAASWFAVLLVVGAAAGCAGQKSRESGVMVPITDLASVSGTWAGVAYRGVGNRTEWLEITLKSDGTFEASSARQIGMFAGAGTLALSDGKLTAVGPRGKAVMTLYDRRGRLLLVDFEDANGVPYTAELRPKT